MAAFGLTITGLDATAVAIPANVGASGLVAGRGISPAGTYPDATDAAGEVLFGVALHDSVAAGRVYVVVSGVVFVSNTLTAGQTLVLKATTGLFDYESNLASGERYLILGYTTGVNKLTIRVDNTGFKKP